MMETSIRSNTKDFKSIFLNDLPLLDVRAPIEFAQGAFPTATNIPLLNDEQRELIGIRYKEKGQDEAIKLGLELATPNIRQERIIAWKKYCEENPKGFLYCFRGGLRSRTTQQWLKEQACDYPIIDGGYKAMRRFLLDDFERSLLVVPLLLLAGPTGSGKTRVLKKIIHALDLEGLAHHRGSAFGRTLESQPAQIDWENKVAIGFLKHREQKPKNLPLIVEDEGRLLGRISFPKPLQNLMKSSDLIVLKESMENRINLIREDYIESQWPLYQSHYADLAVEKFSEFVLENLYRIRKRLGGKQHQYLEALFKGALEILIMEGTAEGFNEGIRCLLEKYYDPMYQYQLSRREGKVLFSGKEDELVAWVKEYQANRI